MGLLAPIINIDDYQAMREPKPPFAKFLVESLAGRGT